MLSFFLSNDTLFAHRLNLSLDLSILALQQGIHRVRSNSYTSSRLLLSPLSPFLATPPISPFLANLPAWPLDNMFQLAYCPTHWLQSVIRR